MSATDGPKRAQRRRVIFGLLRAVGIAAILIALYYIAPLDLLTRIPPVAGPDRIPAGNHSTGWLTPECAGQDSARTRAGHCPMSALVFS